jgi:hypothetical protein
VTVRIAKRGGVVHVDVDDGEKSEHVKMRLPVSCRCRPRDQGHARHGALVEALHDSVRRAHRRGTTTSPRCGSGSTTVPPVAGGRAMRSAGERLAIAIVVGVAVSRRVPRVLRPTPGHRRDGPLAIHEAGPTHRRQRPGPGLMVERGDRPLPTPGPRRRGRARDARAVGSAGQLAAMPTPCSSTSASRRARPHREAGGAS